MTDDFFVFVLQDLRERRGRVRAGQHHADPARLQAGAADPGRVPGAPEEDNHTAAAVVGLKRLGSKRQLAGLYSIFVVCRRILLILCVILFAGCSKTSDFRRC